MSSNRGRILKVSLEVSLAASQAESLALAGVFEGGVMDGKKIKDGIIDSEAQWVSEGIPEEEVLPDKREMTFASRLKELREGKGYRQVDLAERIGVTKNTVSVWERAGRMPDLDTLELLAKEFNVPFDFLVAVEDRKEGESLEEVIAGISNESIKMSAARFAREYSMLSDEMQKVVAATLATAFRQDEMKGRLRNS